MNKYYFYSCKCKVYSVLLLCGNTHLCAIKVMEWVASENWPSRKDHGRKKPYMQNYEGSMWSDQLGSIMQVKLASGSCPEQ